MTEALQRRQSTAAVPFAASSTHPQSRNIFSDRRTRSNLEFGPSREQSNISKINIEFSGKRNCIISRHGDGVDVSDATYKINNFLKQHLCLFTQGLTYNTKNVKGYLDLLSMECSTIPTRCRGPYYNLMGYFYSTLEKHDKADKYFELAMKINTDDTVACVNRARNYLQTNDIIKVHPLIRRLKEIQARTSHAPNGSPVAAAHNTIAFAYNKIGLSCAALRHYKSALLADHLDFDNYLGRGEILIRMSKHQGRANALETLNEGIGCLRKYIAEYNVLNLAKESDPRESPLPRDNKAINNVYAVIMLARALNERSRRLEKGYTTEALDYLCLALEHSASLYVLYQVGDEKRLMNVLEGDHGALTLLKQAIDIRESCVVYHSYALAILQKERLKYDDRFRAESNMTSATSQNPGDVDSSVDPGGFMEQKLHQQEPQTEVSSSPRNFKSSFGGIVNMKMFSKSPNLNNLAMASVEHQRKKSMKHHSSKSDKQKVPFVFEGDNELKEGFILVAKLLKHALKLSPVVSTDICLDLADIYCSLNRKSEAEAMFNNVLDSPSPVQREMAYRKFGVFLIKIGNFQRADEVLEEAMKLRSHVHYTPITLKKLENTLTMLSDHFKSENAAREKYWMDQLCQINPNLLEEQTKSGQKSSKARGK